MSESVKAIVAIGSNVGDRHQYLLRAKEQLLKLPQCEYFCFSSIIETVSIGGGEVAPDYLNAVASFDTNLDPHQLLKKLHEIEFDNARKRTGLNAPRTLDLDIIFYGDEIISNPDLIIPHPRMHERFFVLTPLVEIAAEIRHPQLNKTVAELENELCKKYRKENFVSNYLGANDACKN